MSVAGIDYSTRFVDVVLLDEDTDAASWYRFELEGADAFDRARSVRYRAPMPGWYEDWNVMAVGIEDPRGYGAGSLYRVQGAILANIPPTLLVQPWIPSAWRKTVGLPGNASKDAIAAWVFNHSRATAYAAGTTDVRLWPQDASDAYCIALATRMSIQVTA